MLAGALRRGNDQAASDLRWLAPPRARTLLPAFDDQTPLPVRPGPGLALVALPTLAPPSEFALPTS
jgi:hypothetical protein